MELTHKPVLLRECLEGLDIRPDGIYVDGTLGRAGHSREIAARLTTGRLIAIDRDQAALDAAPGAAGGPYGQGHPGPRKLRGRGKYFAAAGHFRGGRDAL